MGGRTFELKGKLRQGEYPAPPDVAHLGTLYDFNYYRLFEPVKDGEDWVAGPHRVRPMISDLWNGPQINFVWQALESDGSEPEFVVPSQNGRAALDTMLFLLAKQMLQHGYSEVTWPDEWDRLT